MLRFAFFVLVCYLGFLLLLLLLLLVIAGASKPRIGRFYFYNQIWIQNFASLIFFRNQNVTKPFNIFNYVKSIMCHKTSCIVYHHYCGQLILLVS